MFPTWYKTHRSKIGARSQWLCYTLPSKIAIKWCLIMKLLGNISRSTSRLRPTEATSSSTHRYLIKMYCLKASKRCSSCISSSLNKTLMWFSKRRLPALKVLVSSRHRFPIGRKKQSTWFSEVTTSSHLSWRATGFTYLAKMRLALRKIRSSRNLLSTGI